MVASSMQPGPRIVGQLAAGILAYSTSCKDCQRHQLIGKQEEDICTMKAAAAAPRCQSLLACDGSKLSLEVPYEPWHPALRVWFWGTSMFGCGLFQLVGLGFVFCCAAET